jgi:hypothetical protein
MTLLVLSHNLNLPPNDHVTNVENMTTGPPSRSVPSYTIFLSPHIAQATSMSRGRIPDMDPHPQQLHQIQHLNHHLSIQPTHKSHSRSSSHSSIRATSQDIEDLLLDAATDERSVLNARDQQPQSPRAVLAAHQSRNIPVGPLDQPGELRTYQTHIFAPPVTGAPQKKGKPGSSANISASLFNKRISS